MDPYTPSECQALVDRIAAGAANPRCPRCGGACAVIQARPRDDVAYVRNRVVVRCSRCGRSCGADVERGNADGEQHA